MRKVLRAAVFLVFFIGVTGLLSQEKGPKVTLNAKVEKEVKIKKDGRYQTERVPVGTAVKGDILVYTVTYKNEGISPAVGASIGNPIPKGTVYIPESAKGKGTEISYSIDGGNYYQNAPVVYLVKKADGTTQEKVATPEMYTHIRWLIKIPIPAGASGEVEFKVKVQ
jgi:uncharacterized repeat protein (TIGR01451 family)